MLTSDRAIVVGPELRRGQAATYRSLVAAHGEEHQVRIDLSGPSGRDAGSGRVRPLLTVGHMTDLHVTDVESPARFEHLNRYAGDARLRELITMQRPQEALNAHAIDAMVQAINSIERGPVGRQPVQLVAMTGDATDNTQWNELVNFMALLDAGTVKPGSGGPKFEGAQAVGWPDDVAWKPDGVADRPDRFTFERGFPHLPGLLERATRSFQAHGLAMPWIGGYGNHEEVCQGVGRVTPALAAAMVGSHKPVAPPLGLDPATAVDLFASAPESFMDAPGVSVTADPDRKPAQLPAFLEAHLQSRSKPLGHGFGAANREQGHASYVHDTAAVRLVMLDTVSRDAGADGRITRAQLEWLEDSLIEVHSTFTDRSGNTVRTSNRDRLVVLLSHHPFIALSNPRARDAVDARELLRLLHRFANVVLWLNGHVHMNIVQKHANAEGGPSAGFWEVTTSSLVDWPCQSRLVEVLDAGRDRLAIGCTMVDHEGLVDPGMAMKPLELAGLHRQLAANDPLAGAGSPRAGQAADRNVILALPAPFPLSRLEPA